MNETIQTIARAGLCRKSFYRFVREFWHEVCPEKPVFNWHIEFLCRELQDVAERVFRGEPKEYDLIINVPPGSTKSTIVSRMFTAWVWTRMCSARFLSSSHSERLALELTEDCRDLIKSDKYRRFFPEVQIRQDRDNKSNYRTTQKGARYTVGAKGKPTGLHAHFLIADDLIDPQNAEAVSGVNIQAVNNWLDKTFLTRKVDAQISVFILIMQRLHEDDPTGHLLSKKGLPIRHICLPGILEWEGQDLSESVSPKEVLSRYVDGLLDPIRFPKSVFRNKYIELGQYGFAGQILQQPSPPEGGMFKVRNIQVVERLPSPIAYEIRYWDKAGTERAKNPNACYTAGAKIAELQNGQFCIMHMVRGQWGTHERERTIKETAEKDGTNCLVYVEQEPGSGGKESAEATITNLAGWAVYADRPTGEKVIRADPFSAQVNIGNVYMLKGDWNTQLIEELRHYPMSKFKDQVDAAAGAFNKLRGKHLVGVWGSRKSA